MTIAKLIERLRERSRCRVPDHNPIGMRAEHFLDWEAAQVLASSQEEIARLTRERDEALRLADWSAVENNTIVNQVWELLGGPDVTREGGQSLVNRVKERLEEIARLRKALEDAEDTLQLVESPAFLDPAHGDEIDRLGRRIGFGALMSSASASWRAYLLASGCPAGGEFVAGPCHGTVVATLARIRAARALASQPVPEHGGE